MGEWFSLTQTGVAIVSSCVALVFSGFSLYHTVLKRPALRIYPSPLAYMYRRGDRDVFAIPLTISNDGARRGTILSFDLEVTQSETREAMKFQNLQFGASPGDARLFTPITVAGRTSFSDVVLFYALSPGSFIQHTGSVRLPLSFALRMNLDGAGTSKGAAFDMSASYIRSFNDMEAGRPTELLDARWT